MFSSLHAWITDHLTRGPAGTRRPARTNRQGSTTWPARVDAEGQAASDAVRDPLHRGDLDQASAVAHDWVLRVPHVPRLDALVASIDGTRIATTPGWLPPTTGPGPEARQVSLPGRALMLVTDSVPYRQGGFALRTHAVALAQRAAGIDVHVVTRPGEPADAAVPRDHTVDGVPYHLLVPGAPPLPLDQALSRHLRLVSAIADEVRPGIIHTAESATMRGPTAQVGIALGRARGLPVVVEVRGFRETSWLARGGPERESRSGIARRGRATPGRCARRMPW